MTASVLKQDPNTKRFKRTLIYFNTDTQYANFRGNRNLKKKKKKLNPNKISLFLSFFTVFDRLSVVYVSFCGLIKGISSKICILCVHVEINKRSFEPLCV